jgi:hypothetical protein
MCLGFKSQSNYILLLPSENFTEEDACASTSASPEMTSRCESSDFSNKSRFIRRRKYLRPLNNAEEVIYQAKKVSTGVNIRVQGPGGFV